MFLLEGDASVTGNIGSIANDAYDTFMGIINVLLPVVIGVVLALGLFYGISLAIKYAKAEEDEDKKKAKSALINVIVGCVIAIIFFVVVRLVLGGSYIKSLFNISANSSSL